MVGDSHDMVFIPKGSSIILPG